MSVTAVRTPAEYESQLRRYLFERCEEGRAVRVGEKEVSERAEIVARYKDLFSREQLEGLRAAEAESSEQKRERQRKIERMRRAREQWLKTRRETDPQLRAAIQTLRELSGRT